MGRGRVIRVRIGVIVCIAHDVSTGRRSFELDSFEATGKPIVLPGIPGERLSYT
jgi:hypothetical protein